jgi:hypothetical protein
LRSADGLVVRPGHDAIGTLRPAGFAVVQPGTSGHPIPHCLGSLVPMSTLPSTGVGEGVVTRPGDETTTGAPQVAHIVKTDGDAAAKVVEARIHGTPLEALCGMVFVPQRDPTRIPICAACKDIYETYRVFNEGLPDDPGS